MEKKKWIPSIKDKPDELKTNSWFDIQIQKSKL